MKKLFEVIKKWYVLAEDQFEAEFVDVHDCEPTIEVWKVGSVDTDWWDAIPAGGDDDKTCGQILKEAKAKC